MARSKNPDLLFPDILTARAERVSKDYCSRSSVGDVPKLDRVTLFVTHKCNLFCVYCNGPHMGKGIDPNLRAEMLRSDVTLEQYTKLLEDWAAHGLASIHFTGGEATRNRNLAEFVLLAKERGISCSLTTNGTASPALYRRLVENGLSEIRISIDSAVDEEFDRITGVAGTAHKVKENIRSLATLRDDEGKDIYVILNACVGAFNIDDVKSNLETLSAFRPDAIKFLVIAEEASEVFTKASRKAVDDLLEYAKTLRGGDELLEMKIRAMFRKESSGLRGQVREIRHCFIPLTERTLDAKNIYPCSIYLRYRGSPIAAASLPFAGQQKAIEDFVQNHDCRNDQICIDNCTSCCKRYNLDVNRRVNYSDAVAEAESRGAISVIAPSDEEIAVAINEKQMILQQDGAGSAPFVIIKPPGLAHADEIREYLASQGVRMTGENAIDDWQSLSLMLYMKNTDKDRVRFRMARNKAFLSFEGNNHAQFLSIEESVPEGKIRRIRLELRRMFPESLFFFSYDDENVLARSNCIHVPDYKDIGYERKVIKYYLG